MLGELLRRLLWVPLVAVLVSALTFALVIRGQGASIYGHLPRFFNPRPSDVNALSQRALRLLGEGECEEASESLARLGGAALPVVLPALEGLTPAARGRVVRSLRPVAARMGVVVPDADPEQEILWWRRFWEDRALDFRSPTIRRLARRYAQSPTGARLQELQILDTAALEEFLLLLGPDGPLPPPAIAAAIVPLAQRVVTLPPPPLLPPARTGPGEPPGPPPGAQQGSDVVALRSFWFAHRIEFVALDGPGRAGALLLETQYGKWVQRTVLERAALSPRASWPLRSMLRRGRYTLGRVLLGFLVGVGLAWGAALLAKAGPRGGRSWLAALPALVPLGVAAGGSSPWVGSVALIGLATALAAGRRVGRLLAEDLGRPSAMAALALGMSRRRVIVRALMLRTPGLFFRALSAELGLAVSVALLIEWRWGLPGLGVVIADALRDRDATLLMSLTVACSVVVQGAAAAADALDHSRDPRRGES